VKRVLVLLLVLGLGALAVAASPIQREQVLMDSLRRIPPKRRMEWMFERGWKTEDGGLRKEADSGLRLLSKWGRGPAAEVTGKDTLVVLTLGSEVALLSFAEPDSPRVLSEIQFPSLTAQSYLVDSLLYTSSNVDLEVWNVFDATQPVKRGQLLGQVGDFWIRDTFLYYIRRDTFHVLSIASPADIYELGSCIESGSAATGSGNTVVVCQGSGFAFVDVSNPASPREVGTYPCGRTLTATARGNLVCASYAETGYPYTPHFIALDISTPSSPRLLANRSNLGGFDIFLDGPLAFVSGNDPGTEEPLPFQILSIADSAHPAFIDSCRTTNRYPYGVWENPSLNRALVADEYDGLAIVDISNLNSPVLTDRVLKTGSSWDVHVDGQRCYVASLGAGLRLLDVSDPTRPYCISGLDSAFADEASYTVTARDSFAYIAWWPRPSFRSVNVADPSHPQMAGGVSVWEEAQDMVLRDSFVYCAEHYKFQVVNVARPREPEVVGTCGLPDRVYGMDMSDTLAFIADGRAGLQIVNVARPITPGVVGELPLPNGAIGVAVVDTFAYVASGNLYIVSVAKPTSPYLIDSVVLPKFGAALADCDSLLFVGSWNPWGLYTNDVRLFDIRNPVRPVPIGSLAAPDWVSRLAWVEPYLYAACNDAGVLVAETTEVGVQEPRGTYGVNPGLHAAPNPCRDLVRVRLGEPPGTAIKLCVYDASGRRVLVRQIGKEVRSIELKLNGLGPGLYFVRVQTKTGVLGTKLVKR